MSFLLTPVALICPVFGSGGDTAGNHLPHRQVQEQSVCRVHKHDDGVVDVSVGRSSLALFPIHYVDADAPYLLFACRLLPHAAPMELRAWTGDINNDYISSEETRMLLDDGELQLMWIPLKHTYAAGQDHLCLSFAFDHGQEHLVQIQLSRDDGGAV